MSGYGPPPRARDAHHAERLYWQRHPRNRIPNTITAHEAAVALEVRYGTILLWAKSGKLPAVGRKPWAFNKDVVRGLLINREFLVE